MSAYSIAHRDFGSFQSIVLKHNSGLAAEILPFYGAALNALFLPNSAGDFVNIIDGYKQEVFPAQSGALYKGVILFPFSNRLKDGRYQIADQQFEFPINEPARSNALHGMLYQSEFQVFEANSIESEAYCILRYKSISHQAAYPFLFAVEVKYSLSLKSGLTVSTTVSNRDSKPMPFGLGWHPYFSTGTQVDRWQLRLPRCEALEVDERMIPTGSIDEKTSQSVRKFEQGSMLGELNLDTGFKIEPDGNFAIEVFDPVAKIGFQVWQENKLGAYNYIQIYTPPDRQSMAIEPMTCRANAFQDREGGLLWLSPGSNAHFEFGIKSVTQK